MAFTGTLSTVVRLPQVTVLTLVCDLTIRHESADGATRDSTWDQRRHTREARRTLAALHTQGILRLRHAAAAQRRAGER